ncbi:MAG TPA: nuclear transport factor 2 family protein [Pyrinomonadaceae bacterium]|nr:nuclear transport factor 2 family protein [Pyrinomonadaceae bacterium]
MKNLLLTILMVLTISGIAFAQTKDEKAKAAIRKVMDDQITAWNKGDIDGFMQGYWKSENLVFVSGDNVRRGWQTVTDNYKKSYNTREKMGILSFNDLEITILSKDSATVLGRWKVQHEPKDDQGRFTLIFRKFKEGWRIIHDHTS